MKKYLTYDDVQIKPAFSDVKSRSECSVRTKLTDDIILELPIVAAPMDTVCEASMAIALGGLGGLGFIHRFCTIEEQKEMVSYARSVLSTNFKKHMHIGAAIGTKPGFEDRAKELVKSGADVLLIDVAHGDHQMVIDAIYELRYGLFYNEPQIAIIAGNVATPAGAKRLVGAGADAIRVGIGNGSLCETRIRTGIGIPQITAIQEIRAATDIPIIADGGIRYIGDVAKAIAAGADTVMLGSLLAGTRESPGSVARVGVWPNEQLYKKYRGSASLDAKIDRGEEDHVEGNSKLIPYKGKTKRIVNDIVDGLKSAMSYIGCTNLKSFQNKAEFIEVTPAGIAEAYPHLLK